MARVLVIDDDDFSRELARVVLNFAGHDVHVAQDAFEGLAAALKVQPDVVLMDMRMPRCSGFEATQRMRNHPATARLRILAITGMAMAGDETLIRAAGCDGYLAKPYSHRDLVQAVSALLPADRESLDCRRQADQRQA